MLRSYQDISIYLLFTECKESANPDWIVDNGGLILGAMSECIMSNCSVKNVKLLSMSTIYSNTYYDMF